jgi:hypothetical protein
MKNGKLTKARAEKTLTTQPKRPQTAILRKLWPDLLAYISEGRPIRAFLHQHSLDFKTLMRFVDQSPDASQQYSRARRYQVEAYVAEIVPMSDAVIGEEMNVVTATRNAVDARKWVAGKLAPREYGDQPHGAITVNAQTNLVVVSDDRLKQLQALRQEMLTSPQPGQPPG